MGFNAAYGAVFFLQTTSPILVERMIRALSLPGQMLLLSEPFHYVLCAIRCEGPSTTLRHPVNKPCHAPMLAANPISTTNTYMMPAVELWTGQGVYASGIRFY